MGGGGGGGGIHIYFVVTTSWPIYWRDFSPTAIDATWPLATYIANLSKGVKKGYFSQFYFLVSLNNIEILGMNVGTIVYYA